jgi:heme oxygenase
LAVQLIAKQLKTALDLDRTSGAAFFSGYGRATGAMWRAFCAVLNAEIRDLIIQSRSRGGLRHF